MRISFIIIAAVLFSGGCARVYNPAIRHGATYSRNSHNLKLPPLAVRTSAVGFVGLKGRSSLRVAVAVGRVGLSFSDSGKIAQLAIRTHLKGAVDTTIIDTLAAFSRDFRPSYHYGMRLHTPPGRYNIHVQITDLANDTHTKQKVRAAVPAPTTTGIGSVRASAKDSAGWHPLAGYNVAGHVDSLRFTLRTTPDSSGPMMIRAYLLRYKADRSVSTLFYRMDDPRYRLSSLVHKGIDYEDSIVLHTDRRHLSGAGPVQIRFQFPALPKGNYRFEVQAAGKMKARDFAMRSPDFPAAITPRERAAPLIGLLTSSQYGIYSKMMAISNSDSLRAAVTRFWQVCMDSATARRVAAKFYRRVRQANRLFTNYKAGWKTDRGMFYILFGPPSKVIYNRSLRSPLQVAHFRRSEHLTGPHEGWCYYYANTDYDYEIFVQVHPPAGGFPFEHFMIGGFGRWWRWTIVKDKEIHQQWWRSGRILRSKFPPPTLLIDTYGPCSNAR